LLPLHAPGPSQCGATLLNQVGTYLEKEEEDSKLAYLCFVRKSETSLLELPLEDNDKTLLT